MKEKNIKVVLFVLSLLPYIFVLYEAKEGARRCSSTWSFMCSTNYFEELRIWCLLFSPFLVCCVIYDIYFFVSLINNKSKDLEKNNNN